MVPLIGVPDLTPLAAKTVLSTVFPSQTKIRIIVQLVTG
jgi:hypothetical protein